MSSIYQFIMQDEDKASPRIRRKKCLVLQFKEHELIQFGDVQFKNSQTVNYYIKKITDLKKKICMI